jgi:hypothetical protein
VYFVQFGDKKVVSVFVAFSCAASERDPVHSAVWRQRKQTTLPNGCSTAAVRLSFFLDSMFGGEKKTNNTWSSRFPTKPDCRA